jgi:hypothetical protein
MNDNPVALFDLAGDNIPLPLVAAQYRRSTLLAAYGAATKGSGIEWL